MAAVGLWGELIQNSCAFSRTLDRWHPNPVESHWIQSVATTRLECACNLRSFDTLDTIMMESEWFARLTSQTV